MRMPAAGVLVSSEQKRLDTGKLSIFSDKFELMNLPTPHCPRTQEQSTTKTVSVRLLERTAKDWGVEYRTSQPIRSRRHPQKGKTTVDLEKETLRPNLAAIQGFSSWDCPNLLTTFWNHGGSFYDYRLPMTIPQISNLLALMADPLQTVVLQVVKPLPVWLGKFQMNYSVAGKRTACQLLSPERPLRPTSSWWMATSRSTSCEMALDGQRGCLEWHPTATP
ncbi:hypothetical protein LP417_33840 (plasmid) [Polaromonas sp. P1-6]|nr:hypothetical protein LP417_33840 [Polaromonas sp. P1-6]